jgi:hypothetical protein
MKIKYNLEEFKYIFVCKYVSDFFLDHIYTMTPMREFINNHDKHVK